METIIINSSDSTVNKKIKDFLTQLKVTFETKTEPNYDPTFVKMIKERSESAKKGNTIVYTEALKKRLKISDSR